MADDGGRALALHLPRTRIVSIEHPCIVRSLVTAVKSLGGEQQLQHALQHEIGDSKKLNNGVEPFVGVSLRPSDPFAKKMASTAVSTNNLLVKVRLPKRTGRKRKRGSDGPYEASPFDALSSTPPVVTASNLLRCMRDNADRIHLQPVGIITDTHRFCHPPDLQLRADEVPVMRILRDHVFPTDYETHKTFDPTTIVTPDKTNSLPGPPTFLPIDLQTFEDPAPQAIAPSQPATKKPTVPQVKPNRAPRKKRSPAPPLRTFRADRLAPQMPRGPRPDLKPLRPDYISYHIVDKFKAAFEIRPVMTRSYYHSVLSHRDDDLRKALPHVAYYLDGGPWGNSVVRFGIDPRSDPKYRFYQTINYCRNICKAIRAGPAYGTPKVWCRDFDGSKTVRPEETWQLCDFTNTRLKTMIRNAPVRPFCDDLFGWLYTGTLAKVCVIFRAMMMQLSYPNAPEWNISDAEYDILAALPDNVPRASDCYLNPQVHGPVVRRLARAVGDEAASPTFIMVSGYIDRASPGNEPLAFQAGRSSGGGGQGNEREDYEEDEDEDEGEEEAHEDEDEDDLNETTNMNEANDHDDDEDDDEDRDRDTSNGVDEDELRALRQQFGVRASES